MELQKASFKNLDTGEEMKVQFNPTELSFTKGAQFAEIAIPGIDAPVLQFVRGSSETIRVELFFDTTDESTAEHPRSVTDKINAFYNLVKQNPQTHAPPKCIFQWGPPLEQENQESAPISRAPFWFTCIVESVERRFLLFSPEGVPLRARVTVSMREYKTLEEMIARLESADHTKARVLKRRERLDQVAMEVYETPAEWRRIAEANDIDDPRRILPGTILKIPPMIVSSAIRS